MKRFIIFLFLVAHIPLLGEADEKWIVRISSGEPIDDLVLNPAPELEKDEKTGRTIYVIKGIYFRENWDLLFQSKRVVTDAGGVFLLRIPITGETTTFELTALGPHKRKQSEKIGIVVPKELQAKVLKELRDAQAAAAKAQSLSSPTPTPLVGEKPLETKPEEKVEAVVEVEAPKGQPFHWNPFYLGAVAALQNEGAQKNYTFNVGWTPYYSVSSMVNVRLVLGAMIFNKIDGGRFVATDTALLAEWLVDPNFSIAGGPGFQYWWAYGGFLAEASGQISYYTRWEMFKPVRLERIYGGFSWIFHTLNTKQILLNFEFGF